MIVFRFLYINIYAFLLICLSVIIVFIPLNIFLYILKIIVILTPAIIAIAIFSQWKKKNRRLEILIARNKTKIRFDTFDQLRETLCGLVIADIALRELRNTGNYKSFSKEDWKQVKKTILKLKK